MNDQNQPGFDLQQMQFYQDQAKKYHRRKLLQRLLILACAASFCLVMITLAFWQLFNAVGGFKILEVTCPSATICYGTGKDFLVSMDAGASWSKHPLPNGKLGAIKCPNITTCFAIGDSNIQHTTDGGRNWSVQYTNRDYDFISLTCPDTTNCRAVIEQKGPGSMYWQLTTSNGGKDWKLERLEPGEVSRGISFSDKNLPDRYKDKPYLVPSTIDQDYRSCPDNNTCYVIGRVDYMFVAATKNNSATWERQFIDEAVSKLRNEIAPGGGRIFQFSGISCPDPKTCIIIAYYDDPETSALLVTTDGGTTWTPKTTNLQAQFRAITCLTNSRCLALSKDSRIFLTENTGDSWREVYKA